MSEQLTPTPGQTVGPFYGYALPFDGGENLVDRTHPQAVRLHGVVYDGNGDPVRAPCWRSGRRMRTGGSRRSPVP